MKKLDIEGNPIMIRLAEHMLFERIQDTFNLHPGAIATDLKRYAKKGGRTALEVAAELYPLVGEEFRYVLNLVACRLNGQYLEDNLINRRQHSRRIRNRFGLNINQMLRAYSKKAPVIGVTTLELVESLRVMTPKVIDWTFGEVEKILQEESVK